MTGGVRSAEISRDYHDHICDMEHSCNIVHFPTKGVVDPSSERSTLNLYNLNESTIVFRILLEVDHTIDKGHCGSSPHGGIVDSVTTCESPKNITKGVKVSGTDSDH